MKFKTILSVSLCIALTACASAKPNRQGPPENGLNNKKPAKMNGPIAATMPAGLLIANFNRNNDYLIDQSEFQLGVSQAFKRADNNNDGKLGPFELKHWRTKALGSADLAPASMYFDADFNQVVTKSEFESAFTKLFTRLEVDGNSALSFDELMRVVAPPRAQASGGKRERPSGGKRGGGGGGRPSR